MQLNRFDGGLSNRVDPSLILSNEAVTYTNIDNAALVLKSIKDCATLDQIIGGYFYNFKNNWISSTLERSYVEYKDFLYYTEKNKYPYKTDGNRETLLGIQPPTTKVTTTQQDPVASEKISVSSSTLQYTYTYYNSQDGIESAPAPLSDELALAANKVVDITGLVASTDIQVDKIRIYRIGDGITSMALVKEVSNVVATIRDDILTLDLPGHILDAYDNQPPVFDLQYLTEAYGILFGALEDKLYYSITGKPNYWPAANVIDFPRKITGILPVPNGILIQSKYRTEILIGTSTEDFRVLPVSIEQGSLSHLSGKQVKSIPVWASAEGICSYASGLISVISKDKLDKISLSIVNTAVWNEQYFICLTDGTLLVLDQRFGQVFKRFKFANKIDNILVHEDVLYARIGDKLATVFTGDKLAFEYLSPNFIEDSHTITKLYNNIYIRCDGEFNIKVLIDGVEVFYKDLEGNTIHDITPPVEKQRGSAIQFLISGIGIVYEIEYKVVGRQNGR